VEEAALGYSPAAEVAAVGVPGDLGEEEVKLFVRPREGEQVDLEALLAHCRATLPDFAVPRYYEVLAEFPRNASQKVEKALLRKMGLTPTTWDALRASRG
jgi:crotonobetaine/carnitine-CoA ligase